MSQYWIIHKDILRKQWNDIIAEYPYAGDFFIAGGFCNMESGDSTLSDSIDHLSDEVLEDVGMTRDGLKDHFLVFLSKMEKLKKQSHTLESLTICGGFFKDGSSEELHLTFCPGDVIAIVGPTGSGKSRLLADIECLAQADTQTGRTILVNGAHPTVKERFSIEHKLIAQLSQNMNYVMDLPVMRFLQFHAESRMIQNMNQITEEIFESANELAGEKFTKETPLTQLSGGQSRALMIADTALLSASPVVLIDEIENAGVDRKKALELLAKKEKIVLMSTHDPFLALSGTKRLIIGCGGVKKVLETSKQEQINLSGLERIDQKLLELRNQIRRGETINYSVAEFFSKEDN